MWKVYEIDSGVILKAGFEDEDEARDWLDANTDDREGLFTMDEMDEDEEYEWQEAQSKKDEIEEDQDEDFEPHDPYEPLDLSLPDELEGAELTITNQEEL